MLMTVKKKFQKKAIKKSAIHETSLIRFGEFSEATRLKKEKGYDKGGTKKPTGPKQKDSALDFVRASITKQYGKGALMRSGSKQKPKVKGAKSTAGTDKYKKMADQKETRFC